MIYTVTTSPTLDLIMDINDPLISGGAYRASHEELRPGGKGINISIMLCHLGITSTALGFVAGFSGDELMRLTAASGIQTGFIRVKKRTIYEKVDTEVAFQGTGHVGGQRGLSCQETRDGQEEYSLAYPVP